MEKDLAKKVVLVTGGSSGIGKATALLFAQRGAHVAIAARREGELAGVVEEIRAFGGTAAAFPADISKPAQISSLVAAVVSRFGRLDIAFNNAGVMGRWAPIGEQSLEDYEETVGVNLRGTWLCCRAEILQMLRPGGGGAIVNTSSWLAHGALEGSALYSASKAGLDGMVRALALENGAAGIRINNVNPGIIATDMLRRNTDEVTQRPFVAHTALRRLGTPEEVAELAVWLCSDGARLVTGQNILVDGGYAIAGHR